MISEKTSLNFNAARNQSFKKDQIVSFLINIMGRFLSGFAM
jgi:hypothetical protein